MQKHQACLGVGGWVGKSNEIYGICPRNKSWHHPGASTHEIHPKTQGTWSKFLKWWKVHGTDTRMITWSYLANVAPKYNISISQSCQWKKNETNYIQFGAFGMNPRRYPLEPVFKSRVGKKTWRTWGKVWQGHSISAVLKWTDKKMQCTGAQLVHAWTSKIVWASGPIWLPSNTVAVVPWHHLDILLGSTYWWFDKPGWVWDTYSFWRAKILQGPTDVLSWFVIFYDVICCQNDIQVGKIHQHIGQKNKLRKVDTDTLGCPPSQ